MIYDLILVILLALSLAYVLWLIYRELRPVVEWDESGLDVYTTADDEFDINEYVPGGLDSIEIEGLDE